MRMSLTAAVLAGLILLVPAGVSAQRPVAVPIVGSPAAEQPTPASQQPVVSAPATTVPSAPADAPAPARNERKLELSFNNGLVTLVAQNVTAREILADWQRRNGCRFVNGDKVPGGPLTLEFSQKPELEVLDSLLRGVAGYVVAPRSDTDQSGSVCGAVYILATSHPTVTSGYTPNMPSPLAAPLLQPGNPDDELPPVMPGQGPQQIQRNQPNPGQGPPPGAVPAAPGGFGPVPVVPVVPGAGRVGGPAPTTTPPNGPGRGGS